MEGLITPPARRTRGRIPIGDADRIAKGIALARCQIRRTASPIEALAFQLDGPRALSSETPAPAPCPWTYITEMRRLQQRALVLRDSIDVARGHVQRYTAGAAQELVYARGIADELFVGLARLIRDALTEGVP